MKIETPAQKKLRKKIFTLISEIATCPKENLMRFKILKRRLEKYAERYRQTV